MVSDTIAMLFLRCLFFSSSRSEARTACVRTAYEGGSLPTGRPYVEIGLVRQPTPGPKVLRRETDVSIGT